MRVPDICLSKRQKQILRLRLEGKQNKEIGHALNISEMTVKVHVKAIQRLVGSKRLPDLVRVAIQQNVLPVDHPLLVAVRGEPA